MACLIFPKYITLNNTAPVPKNPSNQTPFLFHLIEENIKGTNRVFAPCNNKGGFKGLETKRENTITRL